MVLSLDRSSMGWLESSSSLVLDAAASQLGPLSLPLWFTVLYVQSSSQGSLFHFYCLLTLLPRLLSLFMAFSHSFQYLFGSSSTSVDSPSTATLGVPCSALS